MAATLLSSPRATALIIYVVRAFLELRGIVSSNKKLASKVHSLERKVPVHERNVAELAELDGSTAQRAADAADAAGTAQAAHRVHHA